MKFQSLLLTIVLALTACTPASVRSASNPSASVPVASTADALPNPLLVGPGPADTGLILLMSDGRSVDPANQQPIASLYRLSGSGELYWLYTPPNSSLQDFAVSADGAWLAFALRNVPAQSDLYRMRTDGSQLQKLTDTPYDEFAPAWSPDGKYLAYAARVDGQETEIMRMDAGGSNVLRVKAGQAGSNPHWSADSQWISFISTQAGGHKVQRISVDGTQSVELDRSPTFDIFAGWAPDGLAYAYLNNQQGKSTLVLFDSISNGHFELGSTRGHSLRDIWSPDSRWLVFDGKMDDSSHSEDLILWDAQTAEKTNLTRTIPLQGVTFLAWAPDSSRVMLQVTAPGESPTVYMVDRAAQVVHPISGLSFISGIQRAYWGVLAPASAPMKSIEKGVLPSALAAPTQAASSEILAGGSVQVHPIEPAVNVRSGPGVYYAVIGEAEESVALEATGCFRNCEWLQIRFSTAASGKAWIYTPLTDYKEENVPLPEITDLPPTPAP